jgi:hypothetical protein
MSTTASEKAGSAGQHQGAAMKKGWQTKQLGELCRFIDYRGKTPEKTASGLRLITAKNVKMGYLQENPMEFVAPESYDSWMTRGIPKIGDVLFTTEAPLANVAQLDTDEKVVFAQRIIVLQPAANNLDRTFLKYLAQSGTAPSACSRTPKRFAQFAACLQWRSFGVRNKRKRSCAFRRLPRTTSLKAELRLRLVHALQSASRSLRLR